MPSRSRKTPRGARAPGGRAGRFARRLLPLVAIVLLCVGAYAARRPLLVGGARLLTVRDDLRPADAILVLGGDMDSRPEEAARLYQRALAPRILLVREADPPSVVLGVRPNPTDGDVAVLRRLGVPAAAIQVLGFPGGATSTYDEARAFREWAYMARPRTLIVVTNAFHTRRTRWLLRHQLDRLRTRVLMDPVRDWQFDETNWWQHERGLVTYLEEYLKFGHEWLRD